MKKIVALLALTFCFSFAPTFGDEGHAVADQSLPFPINPGWVARYVHENSEGLPGSVVASFTLALGAVENSSDRQRQWIVLQAKKADGDHFGVWLLASDYPSENLSSARSSVSRYLLEEGEAGAVEFRNRRTGKAVLPAVGGWRHLIPHAVPNKSKNNLEGEVFPENVHYLGHRYHRDSLENSRAVPSPPKATVIELLPDLLIGLPHNTRQKDETRRYDDSDYELIPLTREDFNTMIDSGLTCLKIDAEQIAWVDRRNVFYWGIGGADIPFPECLYRSNYLGPTLFMDEPAVHTRDGVIRPRFAKDPASRKSITPQIMFDEFTKYFDHANDTGAPKRFLDQFASRPEVDLGDMHFVQENLYSWETMISTAAYQLSRNEHSPSSIVFEPPDRVGTRRTLPELNMTYGCQIPTDSPKNLTSILYGFLRGAARLTKKSWGMSIYGSVDRTDAFWFQTHAYDLGARHFFFWDSHRLATVPFNECLALANNLRGHAENFPERDLQRLREAAEVAILLPPGYNLGHVHLGKGSLWGLGELNLERLNREGVKYRVVMQQFFTEIERCLRLGVAFDLLWDLPDTTLSGYREVIRVREDGKIEIIKDSDHVVLDNARTPARPEGLPPQLSVQLSTTQGSAPLLISARAIATETASPIFYTFGANSDGVYQNAVVGWEIYGPEEEDYRYLIPPGRKPTVVKKGGVAEVDLKLTLARPGNYRLRIATVDLAGRSTVVWKTITVTR